ncbi:DDE transposase family protein [Pseudanabaena sp. UWO311]|uniref:DDE transposase family protein n=1 Tax=Pseudanabaena sp. UWO311 TaxID=2487337 RepID=UPI001159C32E|nr:DDE transposase family protein [Pseudanabaena sp. UWO311]TYQ25288.1 DDE transposase family protein [Pseudanabaena sp. UWO311]
MSAQIDNSKDLGDRTDSEQWFICKRDTGICEIVKSDRNDEILDSVETWGAFASQSEAIAKRVGLIRAGKCKPQ